MEKDKRTGIKGKKGRKGKKRKAKKDPFSHRMNKCLKKVFF